MIRSKIGYKSGGPKIQKALNVEIEEKGLGIQPKRVSSIGL
jgi:hypothetical protein